MSVSKNIVDASTLLSGVRNALVVGMILASGIAAQAATDTWAGSAGNTDWNQATWTGGNATPVSGDSLVFTSANASGSNTLTDTLTSSSFNIAGITFNSGALAYTMTGNAFALTGNITNSSTSLETINNAISTTAVRTVTMTSGGGNVTLGGNISGTGGGLTTAGTGTLTLSGTNSYTGTTTVGATGILVFQGSAAMSSSSALSTATGATFSLLSDNDATFTAASWGPSGGSTTTINVGPVSTGSGNSLTLSIAPVTAVGGNNGATMTFNVTGSSSDRLIFSGGDLQFTNVASSTLTLNPTTANLTVSKNITQTNSGKVGVLTLDGTSANNIYSGNITNGNGTVAVTKSNSSTWTLSGNNSFTGAVNVTGGTLQLQANNGNTSNFTTASTALGTTSGRLTLSTGTTLQLRSDTSVSFNGTDGLGNLNSKTITIDVNNITAGTTNGATNGGAQDQTLTMGSATTGLGTTGQFNITGGDGYTLAFGALPTANGSGNT